MAKSAKARAYFKTRKAYNSYKRLYKSRKQTLEKKGYSMYDEMLTFTEYKTAAPDMRETLKKKVAKGKRKVVGSINRALVSEQAYELSEEQGYAIFDFLRTNAEKYNIEFDYSNINAALMKIREGTWLREDVGLWDMIKDFRAEYYKEHGYTKESKKALYGTEEEPGLVAQTFFGS